MAEQLVVLTNTPPSPILTVRRTTAHVSGWYVIKSNFSIASKKALVENEWKEQAHEQS